MKINLKEHQTKMIVCLEKIIEAVKKDETSCFCLISTIRNSFPALLSNGVCDAMLPDMIGGLELMKTRMVNRLDKFYEERIKEKENNETKNNT